MEIYNLIVRFIVIFVWYILSQKLFISLHEDFKEKPSDFFKGYLLGFKTFTKALALYCITVLFVVLIMGLSGFAFNYVGIENILSNNVSIYSEVL